MVTKVEQFQPTPKSNIIINRKGKMRQVKGPRSWRPIYGAHRGKRLFIAECTGDGMMDGTTNSICCGDTLHMERISEYKWRHQKVGKQYPYHYITIKNGWSTIVQIESHDPLTRIFNFSKLNPDKSQYPDFELHESEIADMYRITSTIRHYPYSVNDEDYIVHDNIINEAKVQEVSSC